MVIGEDGLSIDWPIIIMVRIDYHCEDGLYIMEKMDWLIIMG